MPDEFENNCTFGEDFESSSICFSCDFRDACREAAQGNDSSVVPSPRFFRLRPGETADISIIGGYPLHRVHWIGNFTPPTEPYLRSPRIARDQYDSKFIALLDDCLQEGLYTHVTLVARVMREFPEFDQAIVEGVIRGLLVPEETVFPRRFISRHQGGELIFSGVCPYGTFGNDCDRFDECSGCPQFFECQDTYLFS